MSQQLFSFEEKISSHILFLHNYMSHVRNSLCYESKSGSWVHDSVCIESYGLVKDLVYVLVK